MSSPKISVITPVYNAEKFLRFTLDSVFGQTLHDIEMICVDDGSTDSSLTILKEYAKEEPRLKVITQVNAGSGAARNRGMKEASGEFVAFMDADDAYPDPSTLQLLYEAVKRDGTRIAGGSLQIFNTDGKQPVRYRFSLAGNAFDRDAVMAYKDYQYDYAYQRFIFERSMLSNAHIDFPLYLRYQDPPFFVRAMHTAGRFSTLKRVTYMYRFGYKQIDWNNIPKAVDCCNALKEVLIFSKSNGYAALHWYTVCRLNGYVQAMLKDRVPAKPIRVAIQGLLKAVDLPFARSFHPCNLIRLIPTRLGIKFYRFRQKMLSLYLRVLLFPLRLSKQNRKSIANRAVNMFNDLSVTK